MTAWYHSWGMNSDWAWFSSTMTGILVIALPLMLAVAMIIYAERKIWAAIALRRGPNVVVPFDVGVVLTDINVGLLYILAASSLGVYGVIIAGWASNSKYPFFSALRAAAQMVSYEVSIGFVLICVVLYANSFNLTAIVLGQKGHVF